MRLETTGMLIEPEIKRWFPENVVMSNFIRKPIFMRQRLN